MKALLLAASAASFALPAIAQQNCAPRAEVIEALSGRWGEARQSLMLAQGLVFEVWANEGTGTWTYLRTDPRGVSCVMASGKNYSTISEAPDGEDT